MLVKFSVVVFAGPNTRVAVIGSLPELGSWKTDSATPLYPQEVPLSCVVPTYFSAVVDVSSSGPSKKEKATASATSFTYKFIRWELGSTPEPVDPKAFQLPPAKQVCQPPVAEHGFLYDVSQLALPVPLAGAPDHIVSPYGNPPAANHAVIWEGDGPHHNRSFFIDASEAAAVNVQDERLVHVCNSENMFTNDTTDGTYYALPPADFMDPTFLRAGLKTEFVHTTRYYNRVRDFKCIHFNEIIPRIFCGSCPRRLCQLRMLRDVYNVATVFCLQSNQDIAANWIDDDLYPDITDRSPLNLHNIYSQEKISLVHLPTEDMCTEARAAMMAQAAWLMTGILVDRPQANVYVHCNAGVGRAVACVCAFLHFCLGLSEAHTVHLMRSRRPVAYFDPVALRSGKCDFDAKFGSVYCLLPVLLPNHK
eukprot:Gregarina_sp_Poly_1__3478@NODE_200_length_11544_cov_123_517644_g179_i0_p3_GENE_NODE_200_length_11544_cov_123_517644_g179_i0NODE_200_length_11544_cov_123_517644_g179_i0_p3_ORF_typecomplete_len421_score50_26DSPc/PF00782_20/1_1e11CBM_20/PF00686_19/2_3e07CBM_20/PF00686_19/5e03CDKN3/PF05706_12/3_4e07Y_phosphatase2/PF03162_13/9_8e05Y_phosphatase3/PF13350_6/0_0022Y_phosphatase/PF00102_27/0_0037Chloroa_bbind/PF00504_21/0_33_NODE_200_length_11544_cov_123_517644_g179_i060277289